MNRNDYIKRMHTILDDETKFKKYIPHGNAKRTLFEIQEDKFNSTLLQMSKRNIISKYAYNEIRAVGSQPARLYGLPKVHKNSECPPMRPILSSVDSYNYKLAKFLVRHLTPYIPQKYITQDTFTFLEEVQSMRNKFESQDVYMCSYDVVSLFTNVPLAKTINHIQQCIPNENSLPFSKKTL